MTSLAARTAGVLAVAMAAAGCSVLPASPEPLPTAWVPEASPPAPLDNATSDGFTPEQRAAVRLRVSTCEGWQTGSGWVLNSSQIVTNRHVIEGAISIEVSTYDGREYVALGSQLAPVADLGLVTLDEVFTSEPELYDGAVTVGGFVSVVGYPDGDELTVSDGVFVDVTYDSIGNAPGSVFWLQAHVEPGSSGSAVYDDQGRVIGTLYGGDEVNGALAWATSELQALLDDPTLWQANPAPC